MDKIYYDGNLKASLTVGSASGVSEKKLEEALSTKADIAHTHEEYLSEIPSEYITNEELEGKGYLTEHQDISHLALKSEIPSIEGLASEEYVNNKFDSIEIPEVDLTGYATEEYVNNQIDAIPEVDLSNCATKEELQTVNNEINNLKTSVSNGKTLLASAITDKGVNTLATDSFETMADNIGAIESNEYMHPEFFELVTNGNTDYSYLFYGKSITPLDLTNWDMSNVTSISYMFNNCKSALIEGISNWDTSNVTSMCEVFKSCSNLVSLDLSNWDTSNVTNMYGIFDSCNSLTSLDLSNWDMSNVTKTNFMFYSLSGSKLKYVNLSKSNDTTISKIASVLPTKTEATPGEIMVPEDISDSTIEALEAKYWNVILPQNLYVEYTIGAQSNIDTIDAKYNNNQYKYLPTLFTTQKTGEEVLTTYGRLEITLKDGTVTDDEKTLAKDVSAIKVYYSKNIKRISFVGKSEFNPNYITELIYIDDENLTSYASMFSNCTKLMYTPRGLSTENITNTDNMFYNCKSIKFKDFSAQLAWATWLKGTNKITDMGGMFYGCSKDILENMNQWNTSNVEYMHDMFGNTDITSLDLSNWDTSKVTNMARMFQNCSSLTSLDLSGWDTSSVIDMSGMFEDCNAAIECGYTFSARQDCSYMFHRFGGSISNIGNGDIINASYMFAESNISDYTTILNVISQSYFTYCSNMSYMFYNCQNLYEISFTNPDYHSTLILGDCSHMFEECYNLQTIEIPYMTTSSVWNSENMFYNVPDYCNIKIDRNNFYLDESSTGFSGYFQDY